MLGSVIYASTTIGDGFATGHNVVLREECTVGDDVAIWSNSAVDYGCVFGDTVRSTPTATSPSVRIAAGESTAR